jgi:hypothetical protein
MSHTANWSPPDVPIASRNHAWEATFVPITDGYLSGRPWAITLPEASATHRSRYTV